jgi:hypothetical protein
VASAFVGEPVGFFAWLPSACPHGGWCGPAAPVWVVVAASHFVVLGSSLGSLCSYLWLALVVTGVHCALLERFATLCGAPLLAPFRPSSWVDPSGGIDRSGFWPRMGPRFSALLPLKEVPSCLAFCQTSWRGATGPHILVAHGPIEVPRPGGWPLPVVAVRGTALPSYLPVSSPPDRL